MLELGKYLSRMVKRRSLTERGRVQLQTLTKQLNAQGDLSASEGFPLQDERQNAAENLVAIREAQVQRLVDLEFHTLLGVSEGEYRASIPAILPQPEAYRGRFDVPVVVDPRIDLKAQLAAVGVREYVNTFNVVNTVDAPVSPYIMWTHDGQNYRGQLVHRVLNQLALDEVPATLQEVTALYLQDPKLFEDYGIIAAGSRYEDVSVPFLRTSNDTPRVDVILVDNIYPSWGSLSRGNKINTEA